MSVRKFHLPVLLAGCLCLLLAGCPDNSNRSRSQPSANDGEEQTETTLDLPVEGIKFHGEDYRIVFPEEEPRVWSATVKAIDVDGDQRVLTLTDVDCILHQAGQDTLRVKAERGVAELDARDVRLTLHGNIRAESIAKKYRLRASSLEWSSTTDAVIATEPRCYGERFSSRADHGVFSTDLSQAQLDGHVVYQMPGEEEGKGM